MALADILHEQVIDKFKHCYIRYKALLAQLHAEASVGPASGAAPATSSAPGSGTLLQHLHAAYCGGLGDSSNSSAPSAPPPSGDAFRAPDHASHAVTPLGGQAQPLGFERSYCHEVERLRLFVKSSLEQLWLALLDACTQLRGLSEELLQAGGAAGGRSHQLDHHLAQLRACFDATAEELVLVERFVRHNVAACAQLAQMYDQQQHWQAATNGTSTNRVSGRADLALESVDGAYLGAAQSALLGELRLEPLVVGLSDAYELCRLVESDAAAFAGLPATWVPPDTFQRVTRKFWLHPADVMRFKTEVIRHLPVLIFGDRQKLTEGSPYQVAFLRDQAAVSDSGEVTSVYYDSTDTLSSYHDRLRKDDRASVVRLRWYGERQLSPDQRVFVERKVHREPDSGEKSYKQRAPIEQRYIVDYTTGAGGPPEMLQGSKSGTGGTYTPQQLEFLRGAQQFLVERGQEPLIRTSCTRIAFQESSNNQVRISLDTRLHMVREAGAPRARGDWCRDMSAPLGPADVTYFPYAVVEIKLQSEPPEWVEGLLQTGMLLPVPKYSKFLHGTAMLYQHACRNVPYWFLPDESDPNRMSPASWEEMADSADEYVQKGASWLFPQNSESHADKEPGEPPYRPAPLRFLHRNRTAPVAGDSASSGTSDSQSSTGGGRTWLPWANTGVAGGTGRGANKPQQQGQAHAEAGSGGAAPQHPRNHTWPVYQNPLTLPHVPNTTDHSSLNMQPLAAASRALLQPSGVAAGGRLGVASPAHSITSTPMDSAQDIEAGQSGEATIEKSAPERGSGINSGRSGGNKQAAAAGGLAAPTGASSFLPLSYQMPTAPSGSSGSGSASASRAGRAKALVRTRVEPKTFFANERTFLQWLQISVLIMLTATSLLSGSGMQFITGSSTTGGSSSCDPSTDKACFASRLSGAIIAPVALLFMAYALYMYKKRTYQILARETVRYDDQRGPVLLVVILLAVFLLSYVLALVFIF